MADYQRVVEFLRDLRTAPPTVPTEELRNYAAQYAELCRLANERLRRCSEFLQKSLRSEAIHLAEETPNLLDLVAALDLPDPEVWSDYCRLNELPIPEPLQIDRANQLQDAYASDQPVAALLDQHRLLALTRAPVAQRLATLRAIAALDPTGNWESEQRELEKSRLAELPALFYHAVKNRDFATISALRIETQNQIWLEPLPPEFTQALAEAYSRMNAAQTQDQIAAGLLPRLQSAYQAKDLLACVELLKEAKNLMDAAGMEGISSELAQQIEPITNWVKQEGTAEKTRKEIKALQTEFDRQLIADAPESELHRLYTKLRSYEEPIPSTLEQRYQEMIGNRRLKQKRRYQRQLIFFGVSLAFIALATAGGIYYTQYTHSAANWAQSINSAVTNRNMSQVDKLLTELRTNSPSLLSNTQVLVAVSNAEALKQEWQKDQQVVGEVINQLHSATQKAQSILTSSATNITALLEASSDAQTAVNRGDDHLTWADSQGQMKSAKENLNRLITQINQQANQLILKQVNDFSAQIESAASTQALAEIGPGLHNLEALSQIDSATRKTITSAISTLEQKRTLLAQNQNQSTAYKGLVEQAYSATSLQKALEDYIAKYPDSSATTDFKSVLTQIKSAQALESWQQLTLNWKDAWQPISSTEFTLHLNSAKDFATAHPEFPLSSALTTYLNYLSSAQAILTDQPGESTWAKALHDLLDMPLLTELKFLETNKGQRYYILGEYKYKTQRINDLVTISFQALNPRDFTKPQIITIEPPLKLTTDKPQPVPHVVLAQYISGQIKQIDEKNWESFGLILADRIVHATNAEPVVRAQFLQVILKTQIQMSGPWLPDSYEKILRDLNRQELDKLVWYDPERPLPPTTTSTLNDIFHRLPSLEDGLAQISEGKKNTFQDLFGHPLGQGLILKDDAGKLTINIRVTLKDGDRLLAVISPTVSGGTPTLIPVAHVSKGHIIPNDENKSFNDFIQGTPIFAYRP